MKQFTNIKIWLGVAAAFMLLSMPLAAINLNATPASTLIASTNTLITYSNTAGIAYTNLGGSNGALVQAIYGFTNHVAIQFGNTNSGIAGTTYYFPYIFTNYGNSNTTFNFTFGSNVIASGSASAWGYQFTHLNDSNTVIASTNANQDSEVGFVAKITVPADETNGVIGQFYITNIISEIARSASYTSTNAFIYGGMSNFNDLITLSIGGPIVTATKAVYVTNNAGGAINVNDLIPGAEVTYEIAYTNSGNAAATNVLFTELLPNTLVHYLRSTASSSLSFGTATVEYNNAGWTAVQPAANQGQVVTTVTGVRWVVDSIPANGYGTLRYTVVVR